MGNLCLGGRDLRGALVQTALAFLDACLRLHDRTLALTDRVLTRGNITQSRRKRLLVTLDACTTAFHLSGVLLDSGGAPVELDLQEIRHALALLHVAEASGSFAFPFLEPGHGLLALAERRLCGSKPLAAFVELRG